jgi:hypothetical protein
MREGNFVPVRFAVPGLDGRLASLIQNTLAGKDDNGSPVNRAAIPGELCAFLRTINRAVTLVHPLSEADSLLLEKEKAQFLKINAAAVRTKRFVMRNSALLLVILAAVAAVSLIIFTVVKTRSELPTTAGMDPVQVIERYYNAFGELDHQMMEACVTNGAGKNDISAVINFYVLSKNRQAYDARSAPLVMGPRQWRESGGGPLIAPLFGAADLRIEWLSGSETTAEEVRYLAEYTFWVPAQAVEEGAVAEDDDPTRSVAYQRRDLLTLIRKKGNWRITEIQRMAEK